MWGLHLRLHVLLRANGALPKLKGQRLNGRIRRRRGWHDDCRRHCFTQLSYFRGNLKIPLDCSCSSLPSMD